MISRLRQIAPALAVATTLAAAGYAVAQTTTTPPASGKHWHHHHGGPMGFVLHKLNLTADQKTQIKSLMASNKSQFQSLRSSIQTNHKALATTSPDDSNYQTLVEQAGQLASQRVALTGSIWKQIYDGVLTPTQRAAIPGIVAAAEAQRAARIAAWKAQHPAPTSSPSD